MLVVGFSSCSSQESQLFTPACDIPHSENAQVGCMMAQMPKCMLWKHEDPGLTSGIHLKSQVGRHTVISVLGPGNKGTVGVGR